jgi:histidinol-phosphate aminotransferase
MRISRRTLLRRLGGAVGVGTAASLIDGASAAATPRWSSGHHRHDGPIRLNMNENAYGPSPRAAAAMRDSLGLVNRYPDSVAVLVAEIAALHGVTPEHVVLGCGSTGILRMAAATCLRPRTKLVLARPTFDLLADYAARAGAAVATVPLEGHYAHDLDAMLAQADASASLVYICNPNNPTGSLTPRNDLEAFIRKLPATSRVLIDEAYHHYAGASPAYASFVDRPVDDRRVIVTRTLSKVYGLAGLRVGYAIAAPEVARELASCRVPMEINVFALQAGVAALTDHDHVRLSVRRNANDRQEFENQAGARMLRVIDSHANFVMLKTGRPARVAIDHLKAHSILVAPPIPGMDHYIRVSLGTPDEMLEFWRVWDLLPSHGTHM